MFLLPRIGKQVLHNGAPLSRFLQAQETLAGHPAVALRQVPAPPLAAHAEDHVDAVVLHVQRLAAALRAIAQHGNRFLAQDGPQSLRRKIGPLHHRFRRVPDLNLRMAGRSP